MTECSDDEVPFVADGCGGFEMGNVAVGDYQRILNLLAQLAEAAAQHDGYGGHWVAAAGDGIGQILCCLVVVHWFPFSCSIFISSSFSYFPVLTFNLFCIVIS